MKCPVCDSSMNTPVCGCGYDASRDYEKAPTFAPVGNAPSAAALRELRVPKDALRCEKCGGTSFTIRVPDGSRRCRSCGWSPDPTPHIECACGGRFFLVRAEDHALICPLCGRVTALPGQTAPSAESRPAPAADVPAEQPSVKTAGTGGAPVITAISTGMCHTVALYSDGRVGAIGDDSKTQCRVDGWENITAVREGRVYNADSYTLTRPGPRLKEAALNLYAFLTGMK